MLPPVWDIHSERPRDPLAEHWAGSNFLHTQSTTLSENSSAALSCCCCTQGNKGDTEKSPSEKPRNRRFSITHDSPA